LAVLSESELSTISGAIHNGGFQRTRAIINTEVPETYGDRKLHDDPVAFIVTSAQKMEIPANFVGMITAAKIKNFSIVKKKTNNLAVSVVATAGCSHAESAGETIKVDEIEGTINVIVLVDSDPTESCLVAMLATAVEAKAAAMLDLDIRSRYSGDAATGTITDSVVIAATKRGPKIFLGGPASELGQMVGHCVRQAVKEAIANQGECLPCRSVAERLRERHLTAEKLAAEMGKIKSLGLDETKLISGIKAILLDPLAAAVVLAAVKLDEDVEKRLIPPELTKPDLLVKHFSNLFSSKHFKRSKSETANLSPFLSEVLVSILTKRFSSAK
jgi:adenosylcobinamide hydrolase